MFAQLFDVQHARVSLTPPGDAIKQLNPDAQLVSLGESLRREHVAFLELYVTGEPNYRSTPWSFGREYLAANLFSVQVPLVRKRRRWVAEWISWIDGNSESDLGHETSSAQVFLPSCKRYWSHIKDHTPQGALPVLQKIKTQEKARLELLGISADRDLVTLLAPALLLFLLLYLGAHLDAMTRRARDNPAQILQWSWVGCYGSRTAGLICLLTVLVFPPLVALLIVATTGLVSTSSWIAALGATLVLWLSWLAYRQIETLRRLSRATPPIQAR